MAKTIEQLKAQSAEIKNATVVGENTATRVGALFNDIVDALAEEKAAIIGTERIADKAVTLSKLSDEIVNSSKAKNRFNPSDPNTKVGYYLNRDGDLIADSSYIVSGYIPFSEKDESLVCSIDGTANGGGGYSELYDSQKNRITGFISSSTNGILKWQEGVAYARFSISTGAIGRNIQIEKGEKITAYEPYFGSEFCFQESLIPTLTTDKLADGAVTTSKIAKDAVTSVNIADETVGLAKLSSEIIEKSGGKNRFNPNDTDVKIGYYINNDGILLANSNYIVTGYIPFSEEDGSLISSYNNGGVNDGGGFSELYDSQKNRIAGFINRSTNGILKWQEGVAYARFSIQTGDINNNIQVEQGESITAYEPYVAGSHIKESLIPALNDLNPIKSLTGKEADTATAASLTDTGKIELADFPWHIKKGLVMSMYAKVTSFSALLVGKGYKKYRGDYLRINATQIVQIRYESSEIVKETVTHGLNIQSFVKVSLTSDNSGQMYVVLQSKGGKFEYTFKNWAFEANYAPFALSEGSTLTDVELSAGCQDFRLPVWAFGDSYFGVDASRWIGVMKDFGYFNFLVNGLAGQSSAGAYADLERCLKFGTPKFLLWCLGMNDTDANFKAYFEKVRSICKSNDITLIAATVPTVPTRSKEIITQYVKNSGLRYIDFYKAVGTSSSGTWYDGYLNADGVHPNSIGAQALATQVLADFPELKQYGKTVELIINSQISAEAQARAKADEELNNAIVAEKNRAKAAEQAIIFDVSVYNNGAVFESLSALLSSSNLSTLIPTSFRHGGMAIRFIQGSEQSSDNKYVQYRLTNQNWSIDVNDWISGGEFATGERISETGIDEEPTPESNNLIKSSGVASIVMKLGLINKFDKSKVIFGIDDLYPAIDSWPYPYILKENGISFRRYYGSQIKAEPTTLCCFGSYDRSETTQVPSGVCTLAIRAKLTSATSGNIRIQITKGDDTVVTAPVFSIVNGEFRDYYYTLNTDSVKRIAFTPDYVDFDISKIYLYDGIKDNCLLDFISDEEPDTKITTNLLSKMVPHKVYVNKWSRNEASTDFIEIPESGKLTFYGFPFALNQITNIGLYNTNKEYVSKDRINLGFHIEHKVFDTTLYKYITVQRPKEFVGEGYIYNGWYPWIEDEELSAKLQNFKVAPSKLYPVGKNKASIVVKDCKLTWNGREFIWQTASGWASTAMIDIEGVKDICISGIPSSDFSSVSAIMLNSDYLTGKQKAITVTDNEFTGVISNISGVALVVTMQYSNEDYDLSNLQIEFNNKKTSFEPTEFGVKDIYGIPFVKDSQNSKIEYPDIGTTFIFGDSITATNTNSVLMGDPEEYTNSVASISYIPALMSKLNINNWYNFALGGAGWTDSPDSKESLGDFAWMSTQVQKAISFSNSSGKTPNLILIAMGANNNYAGDYMEEFNRVMRTPATAYGYQGIAIDDLDRTVLSEAIRWNLHKLEEAFPSAVKMVILPPQSANRDYVDDAKINLISIFAKAYGMETIETAAMSGIVRQFETKREGKDLVGPFRDLQDQVHPNTNGQMKEVRLYANKIRSRFLY